MTNAPDPDPDRPESPSEPDDLLPGDQSEIDRTFAEIVAGFRTSGELADDPEPLPPIEPEPDLDPSRPDDTQDADPSTAWADSHPLFTFEPPVPEPEPEPDDRYVPQPPPPLPRPSWPTMIAAVSLAYAALAMMAMILGVPLPAWAGVMAVGGFVTGCAILAFRLPRHRPPGSDDGAVL